MYSTFERAGESASIILDLFNGMVIGGVIIWLIFVGILFYALLRPREHNAKWTAIFTIGGGVVFPIIVITILLYYGLTPIPKLLKPAPPGSLAIEVHGAQWWWRVKYKLPDGSLLELANEIRLPLSEPVQFHLFSEDVIHSFWIPSIAGKMDMIPGKETLLAVKALKTGVYAGVCAEYCGESHSYMKLRVEVMEKNKFDEWLKHQNTPAVVTTTSEGKRGQELFELYGCTSCHTVRGIYQTGTIGPDLTHVGSRLSLGAGILPNKLESYHRWISRIEKLKPGVKMPAFDMIPDDEKNALAVWLEGLK